MIQANTAKPFRTIDVIHLKSYKPAVLDWLVSKFNLPPYNHSFKDQWIGVNIWDGSLSIYFDRRQPEQVELFDKIPNEFKGCLQYGTGILVNKHNLYFYFDKEWQVEYPKITGSKIIKETKHVDNDGDVFYVYDQLINLSDGTQIIYSNQSRKLDIAECTFRTIVQQRFFYQLITSPAPNSPSTLKKRKYDKRNSTTLQPLQAGQQSGSVHELCILKH